MFIKSFVCRLFHTLIEQYLEFYSSIIRAFVAKNVQDALFVIELRVGLGTSDGHCY